MHTRHIGRLHQKLRDVHIRSFGIHGDPAAIGHMETDGRLGRTDLKGAVGDAVNALLCGAGYNPRPILNHLAKLLRPLLRALVSGDARCATDRRARKQVFQGRPISSVGP